MKKIFILIIITIILGIILSFKIINTNKENNNKLKTKITNEYIINSIAEDTTNIITKNETIKQNNKVEIISHKKNQYGVIEIIVKNNTNNQLKELVIKAQCYDKDGNNLGTYSGEQYNINTTDKYKITIYTNTDTNRYNLKLEYK